MRARLTQPAPGCNPGRTLYTFTTSPETRRTVRGMKRVIFIIVCSLNAACPGSRPQPTTPIEPPAASTACYAGISTGMGQTARTIVRRALEPGTNQIIEDVSHDDGGAHGAKSFHVVMTVDGDHFTMAETGGAFTGTGTLAGDPWHWTSWSSSSKITNTNITVESDDELTPEGMTATKQIKQDGKVLATTTDRLKRLDCTHWDDAKAALAVPVLDAAACDRACRNFAKLKFWEKAEAEIAALPQADQAAARAQKDKDFTAQLEAGVSNCATQCIAANNAEQTACMGKAQTLEQLGACE